MHADRALDNLTIGSLGLVFSQSVLLTMVAAGSTRDEAYRIVQRDARMAWESNLALRAVLAADEEVTLTGAELDAAFDLEHLLRHSGRVVAALDEIDPPSS